MGSFRHVGKRIKEETSKMMYLKANVTNLDEL